jgi:hypothetical protein
MLKFCDELKEAPTRVLTQFSANAKDKICSCKQKYLLAQIGDVMQNNM